MKRLSLAMVTLLACASAQAASEKVEMNLVTAQGVGQSIGTVVIDETEGGLKFTPHLKALPPGEHGFTFMPTVAASPRLKTAKRLPQKPLVVIWTHKIPASMKDRKARASGRPPGVSR